MHRWLVPALIIVCLVVWQPGIFAAVKEWSAEEKLSKLTKPSVVRVVAYYAGSWAVGGNRVTVYFGGFGSGYFVHPDGYIVTNAHVVAPHDLGEKQQREYLTLGLAKFLIERAGLTQAQAIQVVNSGYARLERVEKVFLVITPGGERLPFDVKEVGTPRAEDGKDVAIIKVEGRNFPALRLGDADRVRTGERIFVAGYPGDADLGKWGSERSSLEWSWSSGTVSSDRKATPQGIPLIQVNAEGVKPGSSGSPVLTADGGVVGVLTFTAGGPHWAMTSRTVQELLHKAEITNAQGFIDAAYREGLEFYWQGYFGKALARFEEVRRLYPRHSEADILIADCQNSISQGNDRRYWPDYYPYCGAAAAALVAVLGAALYRRRRKKPPAGEREAPGE